MPSSIPIYDRDGQPAMTLGGYNSYFGSGSDLMSTWDLETKELRPSSLEDTRRAAPSVRRAPQHLLRDVQRVAQRARALLRVPPELPRDGAEHAQAPRRDLRGRPGSDGHVADRLRRQRRRGGAGGEAVLHLVHRVGQSTRAHGRVAGQAPVLRGRRASRASTLPRPSRAPRPRSRCRGCSRKVWRSTTRAWSSISSPARGRPSSTASGP